MPSSAPNKFANPIDIDKEEESIPTGDDELNNLHPSVWKSDPVQFFDSKGHRL